ncbi:hypothetical protein ABB37_09425 [Leptomonas pyrrhocoris]|uniref:Uncharacterized protein n=1 Tax=Leptomonas pyrrhocoris TaxID=157538 RepID=A0A0M9FQV9_LEPPY|nr:hypothetical protein ABB37_09425 [Leptomonas pyrrhocoris]XP_015652597.1 hypothetical protein ABB37_09425 [Leptomonas pyrrhocoris]XP_015652598.1 hypothetical protein ABB37_09425 [Leptomonas pyrrhocoris]KPA74157.1 hypothetical protein ABB37_09425 [Leptomonas pyrrhocoris]KPA74158.1 hypothetical protein ABB37_09425 [Leptomonas pyrrhocoris]KPA74159.1 hypothetical protein ABB37_09425 [Leptomonas pyrrhocoris]|eukprot:XP_015652596.1 hypothetical protein ABB37_09425 [Leptomonas pyrrhocoris]
MSFAKKQSAKSAAPTKESVKNPVIYHGSVLLHNLPTNFNKVYNHTVRRLLPPAQHKNIAKNVNLVEEIGNATMCVEVANKATAHLLYRQLQNRKVYGRRWKVQYVPVSALECSPEACLVDCFLVPAASQMLAERALSGIPGFLSFIDTPDELLPAGGGAAPSPIRDADNDSEAEEGDAKNFYEGQTRHKLLVSFADEGSALHARAVLSGRLVGTTGVRMFLERRSTAGSH